MCPQCLDTGEIKMSLRAVLFRCIWVQVVKSLLNLENVIRKMPRTILRHWERWGCKSLRPNCVKNVISKDLFLQPSLHTGFILWHLLYVHASKHGQSRSVSQVSHQRDKDTSAPAWNLPGKNNDWCGQGQMSVLEWISCVEVIGLHFSELCIGLSDWWNDKNTIRTECW